MDAYRRGGWRVRRIEDRTGADVRHVVHDGQKKNESRRESSCRRVRALEDLFMILVVYVFRPTVKASEIVGGTSFSKLWWKTQRRSIATEAEVGNTRRVEVPPSDSTSCQPTTAAHFQLRLHSHLKPEQSRRQAPYPTAHVCIHTMPIGPHRVKQLKWRLRPP